MWEHKVTTRRKEMLEKSMIKSQELIFSYLMFSLKLNKFLFNAKKIFMPKVYGII